ncbi:MAG: HEAT repeat domain-containing protein [Ignavibacteriales bacterium]|nr:HEAT repeat domain-containing protein [Ignavibacteriales bacterium]
MKRSFSTTASVSLIALASIIITCTAFAAPPSTSKNADVNWKRAESNYIAALNSDNVGVRQSAVQLVAKYRLAGTCKQLITILQNDRNESLRMAAAYALVTIGINEGLSAVQDAALYDGSDRVAKFCDALLDISNRKAVDAIASSITD